MMFIIMLLIAYYICVYVCVVGLVPRQAVFFDKQFGKRNCCVNKTFHDLSSSHLYILDKNDVYDACKKYFILVVFIYSFD